MVKNQNHEINIRQENKLLTLINADR